MDRTSRTAPLESAPTALALATLLLLALPLAGCEGSEANASAGGDATPSEAPAGTAPVPGPGAAAQPGAPEGPIPGAPAPGSPAPAPSAPAGSSDTVTVRQDAPRDLSQMGWNEGDEERAVVRVIEFSDFGCVHCAGFHLEDYGRIREEFIDPGQIVWKFIPIAIGGFQNSDYAAVAAECAGEQGRFAELRTRIFETRTEWMRAGDPVAFFTEQARGAELDVAPFERCLESGQEARRRVAEATELAREIGLQSTPTFIVQGQPVSGRPPYDLFRDALRQLVGDTIPPGGD